MKNRPVWVRLCLLQALLVILPIIPPFAFLGLFFVHLWSVILVNAILLTMAVSVFAGATPRPFIVVPLATYFIFAVCCSVGLWQHVLHSRQIRLENAAAESVVISPALPLEIYGRDTAHDLFKKYKTGRISEFYDVNGSPSRYYQFVPDKYCAELERSLKVFRGSLYSDYCIISGETASGVGRRVFVRQEIGGWLGRKTIFSYFEVEDDSVRRRAISGVSYVVTPIPLPLMGCGLIASGKWFGCAFRLVRVRMDLTAGRAPGPGLWPGPRVPVVGPKQIERLAHALRLEARPRPTIARGRGWGGPNVMSAAEYAAVPQLADVEGAGR